MDSVMIPRERSAHSMRFTARVEPSAPRSRRRFSRFSRITPPHMGSGQWRGGFLVKAMGRVDGCRGLSSTRLREWLTRVVVRRMTGVR